MSPEAMASARPGSFLLKGIVWGLRLKGLGFRIQGLGFGVQFRVQSLGLGFRVQGQLQADMGYSKGLY